MRSTEKTGLSCHHENKVFKFPELRSYLKYRPSKTESICQALGEAYLSVRRALAYYYY